MVPCIHIGPCSLKISNQLDNDYFAPIFIVYLHSLINLPMFFFFFLILKYLEAGSEPSPIDCFKKFHTKKDGKEWATDHAKTFYVCNLYQNFNFFLPTLWPIWMEEGMRGS